MCVLVFTVLYCLYCVVLLFRLWIFLFVLSVLVRRLLPPSENSIAVHNNNNNNNNNNRDEELRLVHVGRIKLQK